MLARSHSQSASVLGEDSSDDTKKGQSQPQRLVTKAPKKDHSLNLLTQRRNIVHEIHHHSRRSQRKRNIHIRILQPKTPVRARAVHQIVLGVGIGFPIGIQPPLGDKFIRVLVDLGIVQGGVERGDDHAVDRDGVIGRDRVRFGAFVGDLYRLGMSVGEWG